MCPGLDGIRPLAKAPHVSPSERDSGPRDDGRNGGFSLIIRISGYDINHHINDRLTSAFAVSLPRFSVPPKAMSVLDERHCGDLSDMLRSQRVVSP